MTRAHSPLTAGSGFVCFLLAATCFAIMLYRRRRLAVIEETPTTPIGRISTPGYYEVKGKVECDNPITAPGTGEPCVYYHLRIIDRVEESYRNSDGEWDTRSRTDVVKDEENSCIFRIRDQTGAIQVLPSGAEFDPAPAMRHRDGRADPRFKADLGAALGIRTSEVYDGRTAVEAIAVGRTLYAIGAVARLRNGLFLQKDEQSGRPFMLSIHSESELVEGLQKSVYWLAFGAGGLGLLGLALLCIGLTSR